MTKDQDKFENHLYEMMELALKHKKLRAEIDATQKRINEIHGLYGNDKDCALDKRREQYLTGITSELVFLGYGCTYCE